MSDRDPIEQARESEAEVVCPYCGESVALTLDSGGAASQDYVEDCPVCCRPWLVHLSFAATGAAEVWVEAAG